MQDEFDYDQERRRQKEDGRSGWDGPLLAAVLVALATAVLIYSFVSAPGPPQVSYVVRGEGGSASISYGVDGAEQSLTAELPWETTAVYQSLPGQARLQVDDLPPGAAIRCEIWLDGERLVTEAADGATLICQAALRR